MIDQSKQLEENSMTQTALIERHLRRGRTLTPLSALRLMGCFRLSARINDLRSDGLKIRTERLRLKSGKTIARYSLES